MALFVRHAWQVRSASVTRVECLLDMEHPAACVPLLVPCSPATLALNYQAWQAFFAPEGADNVDAAAAGSTAGSAEASAEQQQASMLRRIVRSPQLLGVDVERQVGNLYEAGVLMQAQVCRLVCACVCDRRGAGWRRSSALLAALLQVSARQAAMLLHPVA
jgi:hypothetical protein